MKRNKTKDEIVCFHSINLTNLSATKEYLEDMASKGWMLTAIKEKHKLYFKSCKPQRLNFSVNIFSKGSMYDTHLLNRTKDYVELCESVGWKYIAITGNVLVFYSDNFDTPIIDTDPLITFKTINKFVAPTRIIVDVLWLLICVINYLLIFIGSINSFEMHLFFSFIIILWPIIFIYYATDLIKYIVWYLKAKRAALNGDRLPEEKKCRLNVELILLLIILIVFLVACIWATIEYKDKINLLGVFSIILIAIILLVIKAAIRYSEEKKLSRNEVKRVTFIYLPLIIIVMLISAEVGILYWLCNMNSDNSSHMIANPAVFDNTGREAKEYSQKIYTEGAFLIHKYEYYIESIEGKATNIRFDVWNTKLSVIHDRLLRDANNPESLRFRGLSFELWNAGLYNEFDTGNITVYEYGNYYLLYDEDTFVKVYLKTPMTEDQFVAIRDGFMQ